MSKKSDQFEIDCTEYLNIRYGSLATFKHMGKSDSTKPDIQVSNKFFMEVKLCPAQCGQFVLLPDIPTKTFKFSNQNDSKPNQCTQRIAIHMNQHFEAFKEAGTKGKEIVFAGCEHIFADWIIDYYRKKNVNFFVTNQFIIFPIEKVYNYFDITAIYRVKRSGSNEPAQKARSYILKLLQTKYNILSHYTESNKLFVTGEVHLHKLRFYYEDCEYYLSPKGNGIFEVKKLSNTFNSNVIFSISLKSEQHRIDLEVFENELR